MIKMRPYIPSSRIAVRDSIDDDISDDIDDDVFIKDSRSAKLNEEQGLKRPLMAPRRRNSKSSHSIPIMKRRRLCWRCCEPFCYGLAGLTILVALISLAALILTLFPLPLNKFKVWFRTDKAYSNLSLEQEQIGVNLTSEYIPCSQINVQKLWARTFPRMNSESPLRKADLNGDGIKDIIFGFGVDDNIQFEGYPLPHCKTAQHENEEIPCDGGVIALNGVNGDLLWQSWSVSNVFSLICTEDIDRDGYPDCVAAGKLGMVIALSGRNGNYIWIFHELEIETNSPVVMDLYTINVVRDLDGDEISEILAVHLEEREESKAGHIKVISGKTGKTLRTVPTPYREEVFVPLQVIVQQDGTELLLITTGGQNTPGGLYTIRLLSLMQFTSEKQYTPLFQTPNSGFMMPAIITDITGDRVDDIVVSSFNSTIYAFDGHTYGMLWNYTFPASEGVSSIVPGHFNHDKVPDFMIKYSTGPGFPVYYYSQTTILDGVNGRPLLDAMMTDSGGPNSLLGGITISQTFGGDIFLHWQMQCRGKSDAKDAYEFIPNSDIIMQARADTCRLRYNSSSVVKLYAIARHLEPPGAVIFSSDDLDVHLNRTQRKFNRKKASSPIKHPKLLKKLIKNRQEVSKQFFPSGKFSKNNHKTSADGEKANSLREDGLEGKGLTDIFSTNDIERAEDVSYQNPKQNYAYLGRARGDFSDGNQQQIEPKEIVEDEREVDGAVPHINEEYDFQYSDNDGNLELAPNYNRPIRLRTKYPGNRGTRSDIIAFDDETNITQTINATNTTNNTTNTIMNTTLNRVEEVPDNFLNQDPFSLWDLELEKEERDAVQELSSHKFETSTQEAEEVVGNTTRRRRRDYQQGSLGVLENEATSDGTNNGETNTSALNNNDDGDDDDWFLPSVSSTGVLLKPLYDTRSSLDFAFVMNIRESETYPPLFLPQDLNCVEEKISAYKSYTIENLRVLRKQSLKQCLSSRLGNILPTEPKYESQLVITRIGITCTCRSLQMGETCSELEDIELQRWTEFMGSTDYGLYPD